MPDELSFETVKHCLFCDNCPADKDHYEAQPIPMGTKDGTTVLHMMLTCRHAREEHDIHTNELAKIARISFLVIASIHYSDEAMKQREDPQPDPSSEDRVLYL